jgi:phosphate:Na+ symporter
MNEVDFDFWKFIAGLGIFLFGMFYLENRLKRLGANSFKEPVQGFTDKHRKGILTGSFVTTMLQSSSLLGLMVFAFLGGGIISLQYSLGSVFGAHLGATCAAWIVAAFGFKLNIADLSYPFLAIGILIFFRIAWLPKPRKVLPFER